MSNTVIKVENLSKQYRLGEVSTGTISHDVNRWWHKIRGKEDPYLKIGEANDRTTLGTSDYVWALKDINFEVKQGEVLGIIGRNGAGKSTLLKILSRTTAPTTGSVKIKGRVASLLEVGTGFHPELSGRENIFLNGAILGMTRHEIKRKFDEIVAFAGVERYIDTPVKRYSSGMYVRLAFAVAAHLEPEILIVDEVLAVGDAEFQKKAIGKMKDVSHKEGRTVLFVSHNIPAVRSFCGKCMLIEKGRVEKLNKTENVISQYLGKDFISTNNLFYENLDIAPGDENIRLKLAKIYSKTDFLNTGDLTVRDEIIVNFEFMLAKSFPLANFSFHVYDENYNCVFNLISSISQYNSGKINCEIDIPSDLFNNGTYSISIMLVNQGEVVYEFEEILIFDILDVREIYWDGKWLGAIRPTFIPFVVKQ